MTSIEIAWLAGLLEGEGCFTTNRYHSSPMLRVGMTDRDIIDRVSGYFKRPVRPEKLYSPRHKQVWRTSVHGDRAAGFLMTLYPFLGARRQQTVRTALEKWRVAPGKGRPGHPRVYAGRSWRYEEVGA